MRVALAVSLVALLVVPAAAQDARARGRTRADADDTTVTLTGCLSGGPKQFVLTNVYAAESGKGSKPAPKNLARSYDVTAREGLSLAPYTGQRVQVVGTIVEPGTSSDAADAKIGRGASPQFIVTSVKTISRICLQ